MASAASNCSAPSAPTFISASASVTGSAQVTLTWSAPSNSGTITRYGVGLFDPTNLNNAPKKYFLPNDSQATGLIDSVISTTKVMSMQIQAPNVALGQRYIAKIHAYNGCQVVSPEGFLGYSTWSPPSVTLSPLQPASAPTNVGATPGNGSASVSWLKPANSGYSEITDYQVTATPSSATCNSKGQLSCSFTTLTNGVAYTFIVRAVTAAGFGVASLKSNVVTPAGNPGAPTQVRAIAHSKSLTISWLAPASNGGSPITQYQVQLVGTLLGCSTTTTLTCTVAGLTNSTSYSITVTASNGIGISGPSVIVNATPADVPSAPNSVIAVSATMSAVVSWGVPASDGGSAITSYRVTASPGSASCTTTSALNCTVTGLVAGTSYYFTVTPINGQGTGASAMSAAIEIGLPSSPSVIMVTPGEKSLHVAWQPSQGNGLVVSSYIVTATPGSFQCVWTTASGNLTTPSCTINNLANGTSYQVAVVAQNSLGNSQAGTAASAIMPVGSSSESLNVTATSDNSSSTVSWSSPLYVGTLGQSNYFTVTANPGGASCTSTFTSSSSLTNRWSCTVTGLANGTSYTFSVVETNSSGAGLVSAPSAVVMIGLPQAPTAVSAVPANSQATVSWTGPSTGGPVSSYLVTSSPGGYTCTVTSGTNCVVTGLANNVTFSFTVVSKNSWGTSSDSARSNSVTPGAPPLAPVVLTPVPGNQSLSISWVAAATNGGSPIQTYTVTLSPGSGTCTVSTTNCVISQLTNFTTYTITVIAKNVQGIVSPGSTPVTGYPKTPPSINVRVFSVNYRNVVVTVASTIPSGDQLQSINCSWGDGWTFTATAGTNNYSRNYGGDGSWTISCLLSDNYGQTASSSVGVQEAAQHAVTLYNNWNLAASKGGPSDSLTAKMYFTVGQGITALTQIKTGSDAWKSYHPRGEVQIVSIYVNGNLAYQGQQNQNYDGVTCVYTYNFLIGAHTGDVVEIEVDARGVSNKISDIWISNSSQIGASGDLLAGELYGLS